MSVIKHGRWHWYEPALKGAERLGLVSAVEALVADWQADGPVATMPDAVPSRIKITRDGVGAIFDRNGSVIIGYVKPAEAANGSIRSSEPGNPLRGQERAKGGRGGAKKGPSDWPELVSMLREGGYTVETTKNHMAVRDAAGNRIGAYPTTAGERRSLANATSTLRRATGLTLRRDT